MLCHMYARSTRIGVLARITSRGGMDIEKVYQATFEIVEAVKLGADWSHLIEYLNTTHIGERIKLLHCLSQDMEALSKILAVPKGWY